jgi:hypothetical protein
VDPSDTQLTFNPTVSPIPVHLRGQFKIFGQPLYRHYSLSVSDMQPSRKIRFVLLLNHSYHSPVMCQGDCSKEERPPEFPPPQLCGPLCEYILIDGRISFGEQTAYGERYVPFYVTQEHIVSRGPASDPPRNLQTWFELIP